MTRSGRHFWFALAAIVLVGLAIRVGFVVAARQDQVLGFSDAGYYHGQANLVAEGKGFLEPFFVLLDPPVQAPGGNHPPLYVVYLAGFSSVGLDNPTEHRVASCFLGALAVAVIGMLTRRLAGDRAGLISAGLAAVYANMWLNDAALMSETMFAVVIALMLWTAYNVWSQPNWRNAALFGVAVAACALTRSEGLLLGPLILIPAVVKGRGISVRDRLIPLFVGGMACAIVIAPWVAYNLSRFEEPTFLSVGSGYTLLLGSCDKTFDLSGEFAGYWTFECDHEGRPPGEYDQSVIERQTRARGLAYIRQHGTKYPVVVGARFLRSLDLFRPTQNIHFSTDSERRGLWPSRIATLQYFLMLPFAIYGLAVMHRRRLTIWPMMAVLVALLVTVAISFGLTRYRTGGDVCVVVAAAIGIDALLRKTGRYEATHPVESGGSPPA